jgi:dolichyl-diphosphooligosaccharide--protein glycosyltransferase
MSTANRIGRLHPAALVAIILAIICGISLYIRIALPYDQIFVNGTVWFKGVDPWWHMRMVDNLLAHFPHHISFDPYYYFPNGMVVPSAMFFDYLIAGAIQLVSLGSPAQHTIDAVGAYTPAILGTLTIIPVYFIGKILFNRWVGVLAAALLAILPGEFLNRSLLGFTDHHVAEALLTTVTILFLILAIKRARDKEISFGHLRSRDWSTVAKPLVYTLLAGISLGMYLLTWWGALLFVFIIFAYLVIQFIIDHLRGKSTDYLCIIGTLSLLIATIMLLPFLGQGSLDNIYRISLLVAVLTPLALSGISRLFVGKRIKPAYYPLALLGLAGVGFAAFYAINPSLVGTMFGYFGIFTPGVTLRTVVEAHPLLFPYGDFTLNLAWVNFTTCFFISFISLGMLVYAAIRERSADKTLFLVWSIIMLLAVLGQRRYSYYFAVNAALLSGYFSWRILSFAGLAKLRAPAEEVVKATRKFKKKKKARVRQKPFPRPRAAWVRVTVAGIAIFFLVFFPNIGKAEALGKGGPLIDQGWYNSLVWLRDSTPEPVDDPDFYYELYEPPPPGESYEYPETAYGVLSWWDYGDWIVRVARRMPNCARGPSELAATHIAPFLIAQDEDAANKIIDELGSRYVISDTQMPIGKFYAFVTFAGESQDKFSETYYQQTEDGDLQAITLFHSPYYHSMVVRLYNFDCKAVVPTQSIVISYEEKVGSEGQRYKQITNSWSFSTYEAAEAYISSQESGNYQIVSADPFTSPVPLEELEHYKLIHSSAELVGLSGDRIVPEVKIFEYTK